MPVVRSQENMLEIEFGDISNVFLMVDILAKILLRAAGAKRDYNGLLHPQLDTCKGSFFLLKQK